jgi:hypothetical protein
MGRNPQQGLLPETLTSKKFKKGVYYNLYFTNDNPDSTAKRPMANSFRSQKGAFKRHKGLVF